MKKKAVLTRKRKYTKIPKGNVNAGYLYAITILVLAATLGSFLVNGIIPKVEPLHAPTTSINPYLCCDTGDGDACRPIPEVKFTYQGIKDSAPQEYHLLKSDIYLRSQDHHIEPDPKGQTDPRGGLIFYNLRSEMNEKDWAPECFSNKNSPGKQKYGYDDFIFGPGTGPNTNPNNSDYPGLGCFAIPNEQIVYVCRPENPPGECNKRTGKGRFDAYFRAKDYPSPGIHNIIKNCVKPNLRPEGKSGQQLVMNDDNAKKNNLQLYTFGIRESTDVVEWLSPYCKPAIYLYPKEKSTIRVEVISREQFTYTDPPYPPGGWEVQAFPNGQLKYKNKSYDYLYYETQVKEDMLPLPQEGFSISYSELPIFLPELVKKLGLNNKEAADFTDYWTGVLPKSNYYLVRVIPHVTLHEIAQLNISPQPKTLIRVTLHFEPVDTNILLPEPRLTPVKRNGFTVVEWGGIFKSGKSHPGFTCIM